MKPTTFSLHVQWGPHATDVAATGRLLATVLRSISDADPRIDFWFRDGDVLAASGQLGIIDQLATCIALSRELSDGEPPTLRLELSTHDVAGVGVPYSELDIVVGSTDPYEPNHLTWALLEAGPALVADPTTALSLLRAWIATTDADWAAISDPEIDKSQPIRPEGPVFGWATYIAHRVPHISAPPESLPGAAVQPVHRGSLIVLDTPPLQLLPSAVLNVARMFTAHPGGDHAAEDPAVGQRGILSSTQRPDTDC